MRRLSPRRVSNTTVPQATASSFDKNHIAGLELSKSAADTLAIAVGEARDASDVSDMILASFTKDVSAAWLVGTGLGSLDTGSYTATTLYAVWLIRRSDTFVVDILTSESFTAPTMPTDYDEKRLIGAFVTDSGPDIIDFTQVGDYFRYIGDVISDVADSALVADTYTDGVISVPPNCLGHVYLHWVSTAGGGGDTSMHIRTKGAADSTVNNEGVSAMSIVGASALEMGSSCLVLVDASSTIQYAGEDPGGTTTITVRTHGFIMLTRSNPI